MVLNLFKPGTGASRPANDRGKDTHQELPPTPITLNGEQVMPLSARFVSTYGPDLHENTKLTQGR